MTVKPLLLIACAVFASLAQAQDVSKQELASRLFDATIAKQIDDTVRTASAAILKADSTKVRQAEIYRQWAKESFSSKEYKQIYVAYYIENFSKEELAEMNEWAKKPAFLSYINKVQTFPQWSAARFQEFMNAKRPELARRLRAEGYDPSK